MKRALVTTWAALVVVLMAFPAFADNENVVFSLHAQTHTTKQALVCTEASPTTQGLDCSDYNTTAPLNTATDVYLVVARADSVGILGLSCGVEYNGVGLQGVDQFGWTLCTDGLQFPNDGGRGDWPASGGGNRITWVTCQNTFIGAGENGAHAVAGSFYLFAYTDDTFKVIPNRNLGSGAELRVGSCPSGEETAIDTTGLTTAVVAFGTGAGFNPCGPIPVESTTWGRIKNKY